MPPLPSGETISYGPIREPGERKPLSLAPVEPPLYSGGYVGWKIAAGTTPAPKPINARAVLDRIRPFDFSHQRDRQGPGRANTKRERDFPRFDRPHP
jgi:hypothetical protein